MGHAARERYSRKQKTTHYSIKERTKKRAVRKFKLRVTPGVDGKKAETDILMRI